MRTNKEITKEVQRRIAELREQKTKRKGRIYAAVSVAACIVLVVGLAVALPNIVPDTSPESLDMYNATLLAGSGAGGYVLIGVIGFVLGVVVTLLFSKIKKDK
ncbi:DUF4179 domain-containing protein [Christensenellaceae bacterium OttesenSCG-928-K19]|nr:DUF4179 domain-containing protein [Christensenellaceae bacterium OttesenSCG-928-K19]